MEILKKELKLVIPLLAIQMLMHFFIYHVLSAQYGATTAVHMTLCSQFCILYGKMHLITGDRISVESMQTCWKIFVVDLKIILIV
jgi:hypothetical protein